MTTIPKSAHAKLDLVNRLTNEIKTHETRFSSQPKHFHDWQARKVGMEKKVNLRGIVLELLREQDEGLCKRALTIINSEIEERGGGIYV